MTKSLHLERLEALKRLQEVLQQTLNDTDTFVWTRALGKAWDVLFSKYSGFECKGSYEDGEVALLAAVVLMFAGRPGSSSALIDDDSFEECEKPDDRDCIDLLFFYAASHGQPIGSFSSALLGDCDPKKISANERLLRQGVKHSWEHLMGCSEEFTLFPNIFPRKLSQMVLTDLREKLDRASWIPSKGLTKTIRIILDMFDPEATPLAEDLIAPLCEAAEDDVVAAVLKFDFEKIGVDAINEKASDKRARFDNGPGRFKHQTGGYDRFFTESVIHYYERDVEAAELRDKVRQAEDDLRALQSHTLSAPVGHARNAVAAIRRNLEKNPDLVKRSTNKLDAVFGLLESLIQLQTLLVYDEDQFLQNWSRECSGDFSLRLVVMMAIQQAVSRWVSYDFDGPRKDHYAEYAKASFDFSMQPLTTEEEGTHFLSSWPSAYNHIVVDFSGMPSIFVERKGMRFNLVYSAVYEVIVNALKYEDGQGPICLRSVVEGDFLSICLTNSSQNFDDSVGGSKHGLKLIKVLMSKLASHGASFASGYMPSSSQYEVKFRFPVSSFK